MIVVGLMNEMAFAYNEAKHFRGCKMSKYFKIVGGLGLAVFVILAIWDIVELKNVADLIRQYPEMKEQLGSSLFIGISSLILYLFMGPAVSLMLISYGNRIEMCRFPSNNYHSLHDMIQIDSRRYRTESDSSLEDDIYNEDC